MSAVSAALPPGTASSGAREMIASRTAARIVGRDLRRCHKFSGTPQPLSYMLASLSRALPVQNYAEE